MEGCEKREKVRVRERMEEGKAWFSKDVFGAKDSSPSSPILTSIFPPPPPVGQGEASCLSETEKKTHTEAQPVSGKQEQKLSTKEKETYLQEEKPQPFHYNSSIYYGGQDVYSRPPSAQNSGATAVSNPKTINKDGGEEDDSGSASRGNWWQGKIL